LLPAPVNLYPVTGTNLGVEELLSNNAITFRWAEVYEANAYVFTLYRLSDLDRSLVIRTEPNTSTVFTLENLAVLDRGNFLWQVEAVNAGFDGAVNRRGLPAESTFTIDFPSPGQVWIEETGILYGN
jgi:hypothetical protein